MPFTFYFKTCWRQQKLFCRTARKKKRKRIERTFGVLQGKFCIIATMSKLCSRKDVKTIMYCFAVQHDMAVDEKRSLTSIESKYAYDSISVKDTLDYYFGRCGLSQSKIISGTIATLSLTKRYLHSASEYLTARCLIIQKITNEFKRWWISPKVNFHILSSNCASFFLLFWHSHSSFCEWDGRQSLSIQTITTLLVCISNNKLVRPES